MINCLPISLIYSVVCLFFFLHYSAGWVSSVLQNLKFKFFFFISLFCLAFINDIYMNFKCSSLSCCCCCSYHYLNFFPYRNFVLFIHSFKFKPEFPQQFFFNFQKKFSHCLFISDENMPEKKNNNNNKNSQIKRSTAYRSFYFLYHSIFNSSIQHIKVLK